MAKKGTIDLHASVTTGRQAAVICLVPPPFSQTDQSQPAYHEDEIAKATETIGIRGVLGETVISSRVVDAPTPYGGLQYAEEFIKQYKNSDLIVPAVAPHATYTVSPEMLKASKALADKYKVPFIIHAAEFADEPQRITNDRNALLEMIP